MNLKEELAHNAEALRQAELEGREAAAGIYRDRVDQLLDQLLEEAK